MTARPVGSVDCGGVTLRFSTAVQIEIEEETGDLGFAGVLERMQSKVMVKDLAYLIEKSGGLTRGEACDLIDRVGFRAAGEAVMKAAAYGLGIDPDAVQVDEVKAEAPASGNGRKSRTAKG